MKQTEKQTYTAYVPVHGIATGDNGRGPVQLRVDVSYHASRRAYDLAVVPVRSQGGLEQYVLTQFQFANLETGVARFSAKNLVNHANRIAQQLRNPSDRDTDVWKLIARVLAKESLALTTPATGKDRTQIITEILAACRQPCPTVIERFELLGTDLQYYFAGGMPAGVRAVEPYERRSRGFVYQREDGVTYGQLGKYATADSLRASWEEVEDSKAASFRASLDRMSDAELESQAIYWLRWMRDDNASVSKAA